MKNTHLADIYETISPDKARRLRECGSFLTFRRSQVTGALTLERMSSCRVRLCPLCTWRRSLRLYHDNAKIFQALQPDKYGFIFLTLTEKNCRPCELQERVDALFLAFNRFTRYKDFSAAVLGWYRAFEITHNVTVGSKDFDTFHPHFHAILVVQKSYFKSKKYIPHDRWIELWRRALGADYDPVVDVKRIKSATDPHALAEVSKYPIKDADFLDPDDYELTVDTVRLLDKVLDSRRLVAYGGLLRDIKKRLHIVDIENADLVHTDDEPIFDDEPYDLISYVWHTGYSQYITTA